MIRTLALLFATAALTACATPTPYQSVNGAPYGFQETPTGSNRYLVSFSGNSATNPETAEAYLLHRAAELALEQGFDHFTVVDGTLEANQVFVGPQSNTVPLGGLSGTVYVIEYEARAEIVFGRGPAPEGAAAFNAAQLQRDLAPLIVRPQAG